MDLLPREIIFQLAKRLTLTSLYRLSLSSRTFVWLINDNEVFKYICRRDFCIDTTFNMLYLEGHRHSLGKTLYPNWINDQKFVYKVIEYLRREILESVKMKEQRLNIPVEIIDRQDEFYPVVY